MCMNSRKFVRVTSSESLYQFLCLCFGFGSAPRLFSILLKIPITLLRRLNIRLVIYLDDILPMGRTLEEILMSRDALIFLLQHLGFVINLKKSVLKPFQQIDLLGLKLDTHTMTLELTEEKDEKDNSEMSESPSSLSNHCFGINKINRSDILNYPNSSASLSTAKVFKTTTNTIPKPGLFIPGRGNIKQSVKTGTSLVGGKFKIKQWKITRAKETKFSDTNRCIKIRSGSFLQRAVNFGEMVRKGG